jgi:hypothetical protein
MVIIVQVAWKIGIRGQNSEIIVPAAGEIAYSGQKSAILVPAADRRFISRREYGG